VSIFLIVNIETAIGTSGTARNCTELLTWIMSGIQTNVICGFKLCLTLRAEAEDGSSSSDNDQELMFADA
jgi:hypothetical protein